MKFQSILVAMDGSEGSVRALDAAITMAKDANGSITAVYVLPFPAFQMYEPDKVIKEKLYSEGKKFLESAKAKASKKEVKLQYEILQGHVGDAITDFAKSKKHKMDIIVIGGRGVSKIEVLLGSVTNYVLHKSQIPVLVVK
ncbi:MAG: universal stress protein [Nitrosotalea sp.]